jgi:protein-tyrosine phosphatase
MLWFRKRSSEETDLSWIGTDIHSHLVPGIDDGAPDLETSLELIRGMQQLGYKKLITTPHIHWEMFANTEQVIGEGLEQVKQALKENEIPVELKAAAEYYMDDHFMQMVEHKNAFLTITGNIVLVEFSMLSAPFDLQQTLFNLQLLDYQPLIAHPERYVYMNRKREAFDELRASGCLFQLNLMSLTGYYGEGVKELAEYLVKKNYYDFVGSDLHHAKQLNVLRKAAASPLLKRMRDYGNIRNTRL